MCSQALSLYRRWKAGPSFGHLDPEDLSEALAYAAWRAMEVDVEIGVP
jgi:hypothetical protein